MNRHRMLMEEIMTTDTESIYPHLFSVEFIGIQGGWMGFVFRGPIHWPFL